jgi:hypothetical protein
MNSPAVERARTDLYMRGLFWIIRERGGPHGGWPPRDLAKVAGWTVVRLLATLANRSPRDVAADLIEQTQMMENGNDEKNRT